jgi:hypothetical protein
VTDVRQEPPPEPPGGQDDEPPDLVTALRVLLLLLADLDEYLGAFRGDPADLRLRIDANANMIRRLAERTLGL